MQLFLVYAPEYSFKVWFRNMIGEISSYWQYTPNDPRYISSIEFEYYDTKDLIFNDEDNEDNEDDEDNEDEKDHPYTKNPYDPYPLYYFYVTHFKYDIDLSEEKLSQIPEKPDDGVGFTEIINLGDGRLQIKFDILEDFMNQIKKDILCEVNKIWKLEFLNTTNIGNLEVISGEQKKEEKSNLGVSIKDFQIEKTKTNGNNKITIDQPKKNVRGRKTFPDQVKLDAHKAWDQTDKRTTKLHDFLDKRFGSVNNDLNVKEQTFHGWRRELRRKGLY